jgi:hypothetical protein
MYSDAFAKTKGAFGNQRGSSDKFEIDEACSREHRGKAIHFLKNIPGPPKEIAI